MPDLHFTTIAGATPDNDKGRIACIEAIKPVICALFGQGHSSNDIVSALATATVFAVYADVPKLH